MLGKVTHIETVTGQGIAPVAPMEGRGGRQGFSQMLSFLSNVSNMDGYVVETDKHTYHVLIDNGQSCCESWGYLASEDDLGQFVGAELFEVNLVDNALKREVVEQSDFYDDGGGIQFVNFVTSRGVFQLAVYNAHNGYYGHGIVVAKDHELLLNDVL